MALGQILKETRISRGYTESEVAERIKMNSQMVVDLECENYSRIAAPIYGKGYVRKYAEFLGLDPRPLVEEFKVAFGDGNVEKPAVSLESYDLESGTITKVSPAQPGVRPDADVQQPTTTPIVQAAPAANSGVQAPSTVEATPTSESVAAQQPIVEQIPEVAPPPTSESLFTEYEPAPVTTQEQTSAINEKEPKEEVFVSAHLATTPPTATTPPPNAVPSSVAQSRYTFTPEKFTPRTTVFKPEQLPSASAPEPIALGVAPFSYPEPEGELDVNDVDEQETIFVSPETTSNDVDSLFTTAQRNNQKPILTRYSGQTKDVEPDVIDEEQKPKVDIFAGIKKSASAIFEKISAYLKEIFSTDSEDDITKALARKQRRLGFIFGVIIVVILIVVFSVSGGSSSEPIETEVVEESSTQGEILDLVDNKNPELTVVNTETIEVVQVLPTPKGFID